MEKGCQRNGGMENGMELRPFGVSLLVEFLPHAHERNFHSKFPNSHSRWIQTPGMERECKREWGDGRWNGLDVV
jgi:hypothetical protein